MIERLRNGRQRSHWTILGAKRKHEQFGVKGLLFPVRRSQQRLGLWEDLGKLWHDRTTVFWLIDLLRYHSSSRGWGSPSSFCFLNSLPRLEQWSQLTGRASKGLTKWRQRSFLLFAFCGRSKGTHPLPDKTKNHKMRLGEGFRNMEDDFNWVRNQYSKTTK